MSIKPRAAAEIILGLGVAALGAFILIETGEIRVAPIYSKVGPRDIPILVGCVLAALGVALAWQGWRVNAASNISPTPGGMDAPGNLLDAPGTGGEITDWLPMIAIAAGLIQQIVLLKFAGFVPTATILFVCVAFGFGSQRYLRDLLIGLALAIVAYVGFVHALGLRLPAGVLEGVL